MDPIIAGYAGEENYENMEGKSKAEKRELTGEEQDFEAAMAEVPPFAGDTETTPDIPAINPAAAEGALVGAAITAPLDALETQSNTEQSYNANGEAQTNPSSVTEQVAKEHIMRGDTDPDNVLQDAGSQVGRGGVEQDAKKAGVNLTIAENAAKNINPREDDGTEAAIGLLTEAETVAAGAQAAAEKAAIDMVNNQPTANKEEAEELIQKGEEAVEILEQKAPSVEIDQPPRFADGVENISRSLQESKDILSAAVDTMAAEQEEAESNAETQQEQSESADEESVAGAESITAIGAAPGTSGDILNAAPNDAETANIAPGQVNVDTIRALKEQKENTRQQAIKAATEAATEADDAPREQEEKNTRV